MIDQGKLKQARRFANLPEKEREEIRKERPREFGKEMEIVHEVWIEWQKEFAEESYILGTGTVNFMGKQYPRMKKNPGSKEHPFMLKTRVAYHRKSWKLMQKVKRGKIRETDIISPGEPEQIREEIEKTMKETGVPF